MQPNRSDLDYCYVACGARSDSNNPLVDAWPGATYIGFEPDPDECARLQRLARPGYRYFPAAVGKQAETRTLHLTSDLSFSSLFLPNQEFFGKFQNCASLIAVRDTLELQTVALDAYLPAAGVQRVDFLEIDTQGAELEILKGAEQFLSGSIVGLKVEVEFSPIYQNQPLFGEVDSYLRRFGFMLFDVSREYYRRQVYPAHHETRGQLIWGDAIYLKDYGYLSGTNHGAAAARLAFTAAFYGFHDYAVEVAETLLQPGHELASTEAASLRQTRDRCLAARNNGWLVKSLGWLEQSPFRRLFHKLGSVAGRVSGAYETVRRRSLYAWSA